MSKPESKPAGSPPLVLATPETRPRRWRLSLLVRVVLALLAVGLLPLALVAPRLVRINVNALEDQVREVHIVAARTAADRISAHLDDARALLEVAARQPALTSDPASAAAADVLRALLGSRADLTAVVIRTRDGREVLRAQRTGSSEVTAVGLAAPRAAAVSLVAIPGGRRLLRLVVPLAEGVDGELVGLFHSDALTAAVEPFEFAKEARLALGEGDSALLGGGPEGLQSFPAEAVRQAQSAAAWGAGRYDGAQGPPVLAAYSPVEGTSWFVISAQPASIAEAVVHTMRREAALSVGFAVLLTGLLSGVAYASVIRPLRRLARAQRKLAGKVEGATGGDEIADLHGSLAALEQRLQDQQDLGEVFLDRYRVLGVLGSGSMGTVFKGYDPVLQRPIALKTIRLGSEIADTERQRLAGLLLKEAVTTARFSHPNIVPVYDVAAAHDAAFLALEFVDGATLEQLLADHHQLPQERAVPIALAIARALEAAHQHGILHRDIKPGNLLLGGDGSIKVTDFGISETLAAVGREGTIFGTPGYLAPETLLGQSYDERGDLFSLGVVLYRVITGEHPFAGKTIHERISRTVNQAVVPPRLLVPEIWRELEALILQLLEKEPQKRPRSAGEVASVLEHLASTHGARWTAPDFATLQRGPEP